MELHSWTAQIPVDALTQTQKEHIDDLRCFELVNDACDHDYPSRPNKQVSGYHTFGLFQFISMM
jgi:hypothetical protein